MLVSGVAVKRNRELLDGRWDKHDTKDSANVADLISQGKCLFYDYPPLQLRELRSLVSLKRRLKKQEHGIRTRIRNHLLAQYFPELDRYYGQSESDTLSIVLMLPSRYSQRKARPISGMRCIRLPLLPPSGIGTLLPTTPIHFAEGKRRRA